MNHLLRMTDSTGVFQHAVFGVPNFSEGYCTDDNARAFILAVLLGELGEEPEALLGVATTSAAFLHHAFDPQTKRFHNHLSLSGAGWTSADRRTVMAERYGPSVWAWDVLRFEAFR